MLTIAKGENGRQEGDRRLKMMTEKLRNLGNFGQAKMEMRKGDNHKSSEEERQIKTL